MTKNLHIPKDYKDKSEYVHWIFSTIAPKYDKLNSILSLNRDKYWRKKTIDMANLLSEDTLLDVCCGTGKLSYEALKRKRKVVGLDFCENMLKIAQESTPDAYKDNVEWVQGDATKLPFEENKFGAATIGFALRNVPDIKKTLSEMMRVVKPGGRVISLELSRPSAPIFKQSYYFYFNFLVPLLGTLGIGKEGPYSYLPNSLKVFPTQKKLLDIFKEVGLKDCFYKELTGGIVSIHVGTKK